MSTAEQRPKPDTPWMDGAMSEPVRRISRAEVNALIENTTRAETMKQEAEMLYFSNLPADYYAKAYGESHYWCLWEKKFVEVEP